VRTAGRNSEMAQLPPEERRVRVDLGLAIAAWHAAPGVPMSRSILAEFCGCTDCAIMDIERKALRKLRRRLGGDEALRELMLLLGSDRERRAA
jgi:hypothetical protein